MQAGTKRGLPANYGAAAHPLQLNSSLVTLIDVLSTDRFETYRLWANGDEALAGQLYTFNVQLSAALYGPLHMLEVALRNMADQRLTAACGPDWLDDPVVLPGGYQRRCVNDARASLTRDRKAATHPQMVAELNFGFWSSLFGHDATHLWQHLRPIFQARGIQRGLIAGQLRELRRLRNRVAHYEPILAQPLAQLYGNLTTLTGWLSPAAAAWIARTSAWAAIYPAVPILVPDAAKALHIEPAVIPFLPAITL